MPYPSKMKRLEKQYGKPMRQLLPEMANQLGSMQEVAKHWRVNPATLVKWKKQLGVVCLWQSDGERER